MVLVQTNNIGIFVLDIGSKTNTSMTEEEVKAGKCGGSDKIIPRNERKHKRCLCV